jgi:hypothetical protein
MKHVGELLGDKHILHLCICWSCYVHWNLNLYIWGLEINEVCIQNTYLFIASEGKLMF